MNLPMRQWFESRTTWPFIGIASTPSRNTDRPGNAISPPRNGKQMRARPQDRRLRLQRASGSQKILAAARIAPSCVKIIEKPPGALDADERNHREAGRRHLRCEFLGPVEVRGGEVVRLSRQIFMDAIVKIPLHDFQEHRVREQIFGETIERGSKA